MFKLILFQGFKGSLGVGGDPGRDIIQGRTGNSGEPGEKGERGEPGYLGYKGLQGRDGLPGSKGAKGAPGPEGLPGLKVYIEPYKLYVLVPPHSNQIKVTE